jgi:hypothetical protein
MIFGPETWREVRGVAFTYWDRWLLSLTSINLSRAGHGLYRESTPEVETWVQGRLMRYLALLVRLGLVGGCAASEESPPMVPQGPARLEPCTVDKRGDLVATASSGGRSAMCCPPGYVAGGNLATSCPLGSCCDVRDDMPNPPPIPSGPIMAPGIVPEPP